MRWNGGGDRGREDMRSSSYWERVKGLGEGVYREGCTLFLLDGTVDDEGCSLGFLLGDLFRFYCGREFG